MANKRTMNWKAYHGAYMMVYRLKRMDHRHFRRNFPRLAAGATPTLQDKNRYRLPGGQNRPIERPKPYPGPKAKLPAEGAKNGSNEPTGASRRMPQSTNSLDILVLRDTIVTDPPTFMKKNMKGKREPAGSLSEQDDTSKAT